jgi:ketosteroid isomerase-like protein
MNGEIPLKLKLRRSDVGEALPLSRVIRNSSFSKPMKRILLSAVMLLSIFCGLRAQTAPDAADLTKLLQDFLAGAGRNDAAMHERFWADDLIYTASAGRRIGKADILREVHEEGPPKPGDETVIYTAEDIRIQQYGDTAIVAFRLVATTEKAGAKKVTQYLNTGTFLKRNGKWQAVSWQATAMSKAPTPTPAPQPKKSAERS